VPDVNATAEGRDEPAVIAVLVFEHGARAWLLADTYEDEERITVDLLGRVNLLDEVTVALNSLLVALRDRRGVTR